MTKPTIELEIGVHGVETAIEIADTAVASAVLAMAQAGKDLYFPVEGGNIFIPFHAITTIAVTRGTEEVEAPEDALCVTPETETPAPDPIPGN